MKNPVLIYLMQVNTSKNLDCPYFVQSSRPSKEQPLLLGNLAELVVPLYPVELQTSSVPCMSVELVDAPDVFGTSGYTKFVLLSLIYI